MMDRTITINKQFNHFLLAILLFVSSAFLPSAKAQSGSSRSNSTLINVFLPAPRNLKQHLFKAQQAIHEEEFSEAVSELGALLSRPDSEDYFIGSPNGKGSQTSLKAEAKRLLGSMPARARELYELQFGADAHALLDEALNEGGDAKLTETIRKYFHTQAGYEATMLLARQHLDRGRPLAAALCLQRMAQTPTISKKFEPELSVLLSACWLYADRPRQAEETFSRLQKLMPQASLRVGDKELQLFTSSKSTIETLKALLVDLHIHQEEDISQWIMYRGDPARTARTQGGLPLMSYRWRVPTANDPHDEQLISQLANRFLDQDLAAPLSLHPLAVDDVVLMRTQQRLVAVDFKSGKRIWEFPWFDSSFESDRSESLDSRGPKATSTRSEELNLRIWKDSAYGQISSDGKSVFMLDKLGYPGPTQYNQFRVVGPFGLRPNPGQPKSYNRLVALDLKKQGKLKWIVGGESGEDEPKLASVFFLGPPLALHDKLYTLIEIMGEIRLVVLDSDSGRLDWSQQLAHVDTRTILRDSFRRLAGASPSYADGILVCPTSAGAVVAVDLSTRSLLWGFQYAHRSSNIRYRGFSINPRLQNLTGNRWIDATVSISNGRVLLTPAESDELHCLDLLTGKPLWPSKKRGDLLFVACTHKDQAILVGKKSAIAIRLSDGEKTWKTPVSFSNELPSGRGFYSDHFYYQPTSKAHLLKIDLDQGSIVQTTPTGTVLGNLICYKDEVISQGVDWLSIYYQNEPLKKKVAGLLKKNPDDGWALARQGELLLQDKKRDEAIDVLRRAFQLADDNEGIRVLLITTMLAALREDFPKHRALAGEVRELIDQPEQQTRYLRIAASGLLQLGEIEASFEAFIQLVDLMEERASASYEASIPLEQVEENLTIRNDRWVQAKLAELFTAANPSQKEKMLAAVELRFQQASESGSSGALRRFLDYFGVNSFSEKAALQLADKLIASEDYLEAELLLGELSRADKAASSAAAALAAMLLKANQPHSAAAAYRILSSRYANTLSSQGKTGTELLQEALRDPAFSAVWNSAPSWKTGNAKFDFDEKNKSTQVQNILPVLIDQHSDLLPQGLSAAFHPNTNQLEVFDGLGRNLFKIRLKVNNNQAFNARPPALIRAKMLGHLMVLSLGAEIIAIDAIKAMNQKGAAILWQKNLIGPISDPSRRNFRSPTRSVPNKWWGEKKFKRSSIIKEDKLAS